MQRLRLLALAAACVAANAAPARAWDETGHMVVAAIAHDRLTPQARSRADTLLRRNPDYATWIAGAAPADRARIAFVHAATWADDIKRRDGYKDDTGDPNAPAATRIVDYTDRFRHRAWHFIDIPFSPDGTPTQPPPAANAQTMISVARGVLAQGNTASAGARGPMRWSGCCIWSATSTSRCTRPSG
jgi:hypothetical protein